MRRSKKMTQINHKYEVNTVINGATRSPKTKSWRYFSFKLKAVLQSHIYLWPMGAVMHLCYVSSSEKEEEEEWQTSDRQHKAPIREHC